MICQHCGQPFTPARYEQRFCSRAHWLLHHQAHLQAQARERSRRNYQPRRKVAPEVLSAHEQRILDLQRKYENAPTE